MCPANLEDEKLCIPPREDGDAMFVVGPNLLSALSSQISSACGCGSERYLLNVSAPNGAVRGWYPERGDEQLGILLIYIRGLTVNHLFTCRMSTSATNGARACSTVLGRLRSSTTTGVVDRGGKVKEVENSSHW